MVESYFSDMRVVLQGLRHYTNPGAVLCIDIGDSRYGTVNVPTQDVLIAIAQSLGFSLVEKLPLRERVSKDRSRLSQGVLVLRLENEAVTRRETALPVTRQERWKWFSKTVPHQHPLTMRETGATRFILRVPTKAK